MKKLLSLLLALALVFSLAACSSKTDDTTTDDTQGDANAESVDLVVFAAASMTETLTQIAEMYKKVAPNVNITYNFDSSGKLLTQISEGADCDLFISAAPQQMNAMDGSLIDDKDKNPDGLDLIVTDSRIDLLRIRSRSPFPRATPRASRASTSLLNSSRAATSCSPSATATCPSASTPRRSSPIMALTKRLSPTP